MIPMIETTGKGRLDTVTTIEFKKAERVAAPFHLGAGALHPVQVEEALVDAGVLELVEFGL